MKTPAILALSTFAMNLAATGAHADLQGRDLDGNLATFEAYYDTSLNITWLADANYAQTSGFDPDGKMDWNAANLWATQLDINGYADWRLPKVSPVHGFSLDLTPSYDGSTDASFNYTHPGKEMAHLFYVTLGNSGIVDTTGALTGCYVVDVDHCFNHQGPFANLKFPYLYWNDAAYVQFPAEAWVFRMDQGALGLGTKSGEHRVWVVSDGDVGAVPEPETVAMLLAGLGLTAWRVRRRGA